MSNIKNVDDLLALFKSNNIDVFLTGSRYYGGNTHILSNPESDLDIVLKGNMCDIENLLNGINAKIDTNKNFVNNSGGVMITIPELSNPSFHSTKMPLYINIIFKKDVRDFNAWKCATELITSMVNTSEPTICSALHIKKYRVYVFETILKLYELSDIVI